MSDNNHINFEPKSAGAGCLRIVILFAGFAVWEQFALVILESITNNFLTWADRSTGLIHQHQGVLAGAIWLGGAITSLIVFGSAVLLIVDPAFKAAESREARHRQKAFGEIYVIVEGRAWTGRDATEVLALLVGPETDPKLYQIIESETTASPKDSAGDADPIKPLLTGHPVFTSVVSLISVRWPLTLLLCKTKKGAWFVIKKSQLDAGEVTWLKPVDEAYAKSFLATNPKLYAAHFGEPETA